MTYHFLDFAPVIFPHADFVEDDPVDGTGVCILKGGGNATDGLFPPACATYSSIYAISKRTRSPSGAHAMIHKASSYPRAR